jgi:hypothetical protein
MLRNFNNNPIKFFIISVLHQKPDDQLQIQHKRKTKIINTNNNMSLLCYTVKHFYLFPQF